ncbi:hypothetical protein V6255_09905 [Psychromonas arctica]|uniref:Uncharacterized protein n=1 Tax=Psychromonas arctica TaxID=168275 RepID=A0ABU9HC29_9GAMM
MQEIEKFNLKENIKENYQLEFEEKRVSLTISGAIIEKQYKLEDGSFLLFSTDNCAFEEQLHLTLISHDLKCIDKVDLGLEYVSGTLDNIQVINNHSIEFDFFPNTRYQIFVNNSGRHFFTNLLSEVHYSKPIISKKYLKIAKLAC